jgi:hypothetical protein
MGEFGSKIDPKTTPLLMDVEEEKLEFGEKGAAVRERVFFNSSYLIFQK